MPPRHSFADKVFRDATDDARRMHELAAEQSKNTRQHMHEIANRRASIGAAGAPSPTLITKLKTGPHTSAGQPAGSVTRGPSVGPDDQLVVKVESAGTEHTSQNAPYVNSCAGSPRATPRPAGYPSTSTAAFEARFGPQYSRVPLGQGPSFANAHQQVRLAQQVHALTHRPEAEDSSRQLGHPAALPLDGPQLQRQPGPSAVKRTRDGILHTPLYQPSSPETTESMRPPVHPHNVVQRFAEGMDQLRSNPDVQNNVPLRVGTYLHGTTVASHATAPEVQSIMGADARQTNRVFSAPAQTQEQRPRTATVSRSAMDDVEYENRKRTFVPNPEGRMSYGPPPRALTQHQVVQMMAEQAGAASGQRSLSYLGAARQPQNTQNSDFHPTSVGTVRHPSGTVVYAYEAPPLPTGTLITLADTALHKFTEPGGPPPVNNDVPARLAENLSSASCDLAKLRLELERKRDVVRMRLEEGEKIKAKEKEALEVLSMMRAECSSALNRGHEW